MYKSGSVYIGGEENMTRKADEVIFKVKIPFYCLSLPDLLLMTHRREGQGGFWQILMG